MRLKLPFELTAKKNITFITQSQVYGDSLWLSRKTIYNEIRLDRFWIMKASGFELGLPGSERSFFSIFACNQRVFKKIKSVVDFFDLSWVEVINSNISIFIRTSQSSEWNETKMFLHLTPTLSGQILSMLSVWAMRSHFRIFWFFSFRLISAR